MTRLLIGSVWMVLVACATGAPTGGRAMLHLDRPTPFNPSGIRRAVPVAAAAPVKARVPVAPRPGTRTAVVKAARGLIGQGEVKVNGRRAVHQDCSSVVLAAYGQAGLDLLALAEPEDNAVTAIYRFAREHGRVFEGGWPMAGDLVFFKETYDQNRDGRTNDGLTHVGVVEGVDADGTVRVIHRVKRGVVVTRMNLKRPDTRVEAGTGRKLNDYLRGGREAALTGQLFAAYATLLPAK